MCLFPLLSSFIYTYRGAIRADYDLIGVSNKHNYVLAAQSVSLRQSLEKVPGLPIIHFNPRQVLVLSPPSIATTRHKNELEEKRRMDHGREMEGVVDGDNVIGAGASSCGGAASTTSGATRSSRKKIKAPNPLSMKKKKVEKRPREDQDQDQDRDRGSEQEEAGGDAEGDGSKRRKKRKRGRGKGAVAEARAELAAGSGSGNDSGDDE